MDSLTLDDMARRVERLEREVRWWRRAWAGAAVVVGVLGILGAAGAPVADEVRARRFTVVDGQGTTQAQLGLFTSVDGAQMARLAFWGKAGHVDAQFDGFPSVNLLGRDEASRVTLSVRDDGEPTLAFIDNDGTTRVLVGRGEARIGGEVKQFPVSSISLFGEDRRPLWRVP